MHNVEIKFIPNEEQRYDTLGDWFDVSHHASGQLPWKTTQINITRLENHDYEFLLAIHELFEMYKCRKDGITDREVDQFDLTHEGEDPGLDPNAPYHQQHMAALRIERVVAQELGIDWDAYETFLKGP